MAKHIVTSEMIIVLIALITAIVLFATEWLRVDVVAIIIMATLMVTGVLTPEEGLSGFSNSATATVAAMFVLSAAVQNTGIMVPLARRMEKAFLKNFWYGFILMTIVVGFFSAFVNNTPVVALLIPVVIAAATKSGNNPTKILIPLSFISMFGGVCTLVGTSTNILVSDISKQYGFGAFGMFEMTSLGIIFFAAGSLYMIFIGVRLLPNHESQKNNDNELDSNFYITNIVLNKAALVTARKLKDLTYLMTEGVEIVQHSRGFERNYQPPLDISIEENDVLKIKCNAEKLKQLSEKRGIDILPMLSRNVEEQHYSNPVFVEAIISPESALVGRRFRFVDINRIYQATLLGIRLRAGFLSKLMKHERILSGDSLMLVMDRSSMNHLKNNPRDFILISEPKLTSYNLRRGLLALGIVLAVILVASFKILPILIASIVGSVLMLLTSCINAEKAYRSVDWKVIFLLAGAISFGIALKKTGLADLIAHQMISLAGDYGPIVLLSVLYLLTTILTEVISNNATVVLLAPIVIAMAESLGISSKPFLMAITFAASSSFMTPIGYQTNTMVYAAGNYKFRDFFKVGFWLNIIFWILATLLIPIWFPF